jgi:hypothetical protein
MQYTRDQVSANELKAFQTIYDFVINLHDYFSSVKHTSIRPLKLYHRLISNTGFKDDVNIRRHIDVFEAFCKSNREHIKNRTYPLTSARVQFSENIYIDVNYFLTKSDTEATQNTIWEYILAISAYVDPDGRAKDHLLEIVNKNNSGSQEDNFISTMMQQVSGLVSESDDMSNPMAMIGNIMGSGVMDNLVSSMTQTIEQENLDIQKLMGGVNTIIGSLQKEIEKSDDPMMKQMLGLLNLSELPTLEPSEE